MASIITNASSITALQQLRAVQKTGDTVRSQIATGLKVQSADDNPAFFLVSNKTRGDLAVLEGLRENLTVNEGAIKAAEAGVRELNRLTLAIADMIPVAQSGVAIEELEVTFDEIIEQAFDVIDASGSMDVNLLKQEGTTTSVIGLKRSGSSFDLQTLSLDGGDFT
ncbi:MAG: hypothetical protein AAF317_17465, partial [Pseudomonadota bacterium]